jgi:hypothetical protein
MLRIALQVVAAVAVGGLFLGLGALALRQTAPSRLPASPDAEQLEVVLRNLERERQARELLAGEVRELRVRLDLLEVDLAESSGERLPDAAESETGTAEEVSESDSPDTVQPPAFDPARLVETGVDRREAERLRALWSEIELGKLHVIDQAEREGWPRHRRYAELQMLEESVRATLTEESYDRYLYAAGRPNRVVVRDVIDQSSAAAAGVRPGDIVLSYDDSRIFGRAELREATSLGDAGQRVRLEVLRGGRRRTLTVPAGPLGLLLMSQLDEPR